ncbi:hypothetical protein SLEP1_g17468 [Rubroshorea leprosula]|uniref:Uncharacterized protein n=1 Tax=Rubroshorea leprosula TaxID=152421 RepID=A0AAV5J098_9ROSI|nr:hypothetical protein SLEP1_g17468 [Rubroshorea leprosula]
MDCLTLGSGFMEGTKLVRKFLLPRSKSLVSACSHAEAGRPAERTGVAHAVADQSTHHDH